MGGSFVAVLCGLGAAVCWTVSALCASSASQAIGADSTLGWVMLIGLVIVIPPTPCGQPVAAVPGRARPARGRRGHQRDRPAGRVRRVPPGKVGLVTAIASTEGTDRASRRRRRIPWGVPARLFGSVLVAAPLSGRRRLRLTRRALPLVTAAGAAEVLGVLSYAIGARHDLPVAAVLSAQFAVLTAVAAFFIHGQRLSRRQVAGLTAVVTGVTLLAALSP